jgi:hypothetical protein
MDEKGCNIPLFLKNNQIKQLHLHLEISDIAYDSKQQGIIKASQNIYHPIQQLNTFFLRFRHMLFSLHRRGRNGHMSQKSEGTKKEPSICKMLGMTKTCNSYTQYA